MTQRKHQKRLARARSAKTGEAYSTALRQLRDRSTRTSTMSTTTTTESVVLAHCSFCGKTHLQVKKLIAGPGVYICDECVDLCTTIIAEEAAGDSAGPKDAGERRRPFEKPDADQLLNRIETVDPAVGRLEAQLSGLVRYARAELGVEWEQIASRLHMDPAGARARFPGID